MKKSLLLLLVIFLMAPLAKASHIVGGDMSVKWIGPTKNDFQIQLRLFRSCQGGSATMPGSVNVQIHDLVTYTTVQTVTISNPALTPNLPFGDACFTPTGLCVDQGIFTQNVTIPDNPNGYYLSYQICCRNSGITNLANPTSLGNTFYCEIPDPGNAATLNNSNPDMGIYPLDAYLCVNSPKQFKFNVIDPDGDSLVYSLVTPLDDGPVSIPPTFPYQTVVWAPGYSVLNIVGGASPMTINQNTGIMTAAPALIGTYVFAVKVEEFRNGVKIGEIRRDAQYEGLPCTSGSPPQFLNTVPTNGQTIQIPYNKEYCKDLVFDDINVTDTLFIEMISTIFDSGAYIATMTPDINGDYHYFYNWNGSNWNDSVVIPPNQFDTTQNNFWNIGTVANRFCWTPGCNTINNTYPFQVNAYSLGCDGRSQDSIIFNIQVIPPVINLPNPGDQIAYYGIEHCANITWKDTSIVDQMDIQVSSDIFSMGANYPNVGNNYDYAYGNGLITNVPNDAPNTVVLGTRFCWTPDCEHIGGTFNVHATIHSLDCPASGIEDTIDFEITVRPPFDSLDVVPNVITPNGDGMNDTYKIGGVSNPCNDKIKVQIYNRWGLLIYENNTYPEFEWDGKNKSGNDVPAGTYFVLVSGTFGSEVVTLDQRSVTILR